MSLTKILFKRTGEIKIEKIVMIFDLIQSDWSNDATEGLRFTSWSRPDHSASSPPRWPAARASSGSSSTCSRPGSFSASPGGARICWRTTQASPPKLEWHAGSARGPATSGLTRRSRRLRHRRSLGSVRVRDHSGEPGSRPWNGWVRCALVCPCLPHRDVFRSILKHAVTYGWAQWLLQVHVRLQWVCAWSSFLVEGDEQMGRPKSQTSMERCHACGA